MLTVDSIAQRWGMHPDEAIKVEMETVYFFLNMDKDVRAYQDELREIDQRKRDFDKLNAE